MAEIGIVKIDPSSTNWQSILKNYHPVAIEGPGPSNDSRDPTTISRRLFHQLLNHWRMEGRKVEMTRCGGKTTITTIDGKPIMLVTQGDPPAASGVAAISLGIFKCLTEGIMGEEDIYSTKEENEHNVVMSSEKEMQSHVTKRVLITLDDPKHIAYADREGIFLELRLSQLMEYLSQESDDESDCNNNEHERNSGDKTQTSSCINPATTTVPHTIIDAINKRMQTLTTEAQQSTMVAPDYNAASNPQTVVKAPRLSTKQYAMLQEVTKSAFNKLCGEITVIHTIEREKIPPWSVTGFYPVGLELDLVKEGQYLCYDGENVSNSKT